MKIKRILCLSLIALSVASVHAGVVGKSSNVNNIRVGEIKTASHSNDQVGSAGIGVYYGSGQVTNKLIDLSGLAKKAEGLAGLAAGNIGGVDSAGITQLNFNHWWLSPEILSGINPIPDHKPLGRFAYQQLSVNDGGKVYFGEWSKDSSTSKNDDTRTVYYVGSKPDHYAVPTSGSAKYDVTGINQYGGSVNSGLIDLIFHGKTNANANSLLKGELTANFATQTLRGTLVRGVENADATNRLALNTRFDSTGSISGSATANGQIGGGVVEGNFFGNDAQALAGIATFEGNKHLDTAFGGLKK